MTQFHSIHAFASPFASDWSACLFFNQEGFYQHFLLCFQKAYDHIRRSRFTAKGTTKNIFITGTTISSSDKRWQESFLLRSTSLQDTFSIVFLMEMNASDVIPPTAEGHHDTPSCERTLALLHVACVMKIILLVLHQLKGKHASLSSLGRKVKQAKQRWRPPLTGEELKRMWDKEQWMLLRWPLLLTVSKMQAQKKIEN